MSETFGAYAELYDAFYSHKNYAEEADFVLAHLGGGPGKTLLELGIGTGRHSEYFLKKGLNIAGVDRSPGMLERAKVRLSNVPRFDAAKLAVGDLTTYRSGETFDSVVCLFHVINYLASPELFKKGLETARAHLKPGGRFFFDSWNAAGVVKDPPHVSTKSIERITDEIRRTTTPRIDPIKQIVEVRFNFERVEGGDVLESFQEVHPMRYLFENEVKEMAAATGFQLITDGPWLKVGPITDQHWFSFYVLEAI